MELNISDVIQVMSISDLIQIIGILIALFTGIASIIISTIALRQNARIVKESAKAQIVVFPFKFYGDMFPRIRIQNFGNTSGTITNIQTIPELPKENICVNPFEGYQNMTIAPNQSFTTIFCKENEPEVPLEEFDVIITYVTLGETIKETQHINYNFINVTLESSSNPKDIPTALQKINQSIQGLQ